LFAAINDDIVLVGAASMRMEPNENLAKRTGELPSHWLQALFDVMALKADQHCSTALLPQWGHRMSPSS
jgi:hypothetical protein